jgi:hypothetical protein
MIKLSYQYNSSFLVFTFIIIACTSATAFCQADSILISKADNKGKIGFEKERFSASLGCFTSVDNTGITLGSKQLGMGIIIDIEDALGLETSSFVFRGTANYKYGKRNQHAIILDYFSINRNATKVLETDPEFGDYTYSVGAKLQSKFNLSIIRAKYEYAFLQDDRVSLGFSAGFFIMPISFSVKSERSDEQSTSMIAPLPLLGIHSDFLLTKRLVLKESIEMLYLKYGNFTGSILDVNFAVEHRTFKHFGLGLGINLSRLNIAAKGNEYPEINFFGTVKMEYNGALFYARFYF